MPKRPNIATLKPLGMTWWWAKCLASSSSAPTSNNEIYSSRCTRREGFPGPTRGRSAPTCRVWPELPKPHSNQLPPNANEPVRTHEAQINQFWKRASLLTLLPLYFRHPLGEGRGVCRGSASNLLRLCLGSGPSRKAEVRYTHAPALPQLGLRIMLWGQTIWLLHQKSYGLTQPCLPILFWCSSSRHTQPPARPIARQLQTKGWSTTTSSLQSPKGVT
eukprot:jgi/Botrbrau1/5718/Bobra.0071s0049.1